MVMQMLHIVKSWISDRFKERTSWDGAVLIAAGGSFILLGPLAEVAAYIAIVYGAWTLWKKEGHTVSELTDNQS
jgi:hypothetical protein